MPPTLRADNPSTAEDGTSEPDEPVKILEAQGEFDNMMVWGHEMLPAADDTFVKGVEEWVRFAETVCTSTVSRTLLILHVLQMHTASPVAAPGDKQ